MGNDHSNFRYTFGLEEEFFLVHSRSRTLATSVPRSLLHACRRRYGDAVAPELLHSQIELVSPVFERCDEAYDEMKNRLTRVDGSGVQQVALLELMRDFGRSDAAAVVVRAGGRGSGHWDQAFPLHSQVSEYLGPGEKSQPLWLPPKITLVPRAALYAIGRNARVSKGSAEADQALPSNSHTEVSP